MQTLRAVIKEQCKLEYCSDMPNDTYVFFRGYTDSSKGVIKDTVCCIGRTGKVYKYDNTKKCMLTTGNYMTYEDLIEFLGVGPLDFCKRFTKVQLSKIYRR